MAFYRKLKSGKWQYRISYKDENGKYKEVSKSGFRTKTEAEIAAKKFEDRLGRGYKPNPHVFLYDYLKNWYETFEEPRLSPVTNKRNKQFVELVDKYFPRQPIQNITRTMYQQVMNKFGEKYAKSSVRRFHGMLKRCLAHAEFEGDIEKSPVFDIQITGKQTENKKNFLSQREVIALKKELLNDYHPSMTGRLMCLVAIATGARFGEIAALTTKDIDFVNQTININKSYDYKITKDFIPTKTKGSNREITVDTDTMKLIKEKIAYNTKRRFKLGVRPKHEFIFINTIFEPLTPAGTNKALKKALKRAGIKNISFHGLRHTHASLLIYKEVPIEYVSKRLGHSSITMTADVYTHVIEEMKEKGDQQIVEILSGL